MYEWGEISWVHAPHNVLAGKQKWRCRINDVCVATTSYDTEAPSAVPLNPSTERILTEPWLHRPETESKLYFKSESTKSPARDLQPRHRSGLEANGADEPSGFQRPRTGHLGSAPHKGIRAALIEFGWDSGVCLKPTFNSVLLQRNSK